MPIVCIYEHIMREKKTQWRTEECQDADSKIPQRNNSQNPIWNERFDMRIYYYFLLGVGNANEMSGLIWEFGAWLINELTSNFSCDWVSASLCSSLSLSLPYALNFYGLIEVSYLTNLALYY